MAIRTLISEEPWAGSPALLAGFCAVAAATAIAVAAGGTRWPALAIGLLAVAVLLVAAQVSPRTSPWSAPGLGVIGYLFYDGFIAGRHAQLAWHGIGDLWRLGLLAGAALAGSGIGWAWRRFARRRPGHISAPRRGYVPAPRRGPATAPHRGQATAPHRGQATAPHRGRVTALRPGRVTAPRRGYVPAGGRRG